MKQSKAIQMLHWLEELKQLETKGQRTVLTQREQYRVDELRARVEERLAERQANQQQKQELRKAPPRRERLHHADIDERRLRDTGDQRAFMRQQAIVTQYDSFSSLPYAQVRQAPTREEQMSSPMPGKVTSSPEHHQYTQEHTHTTSHTPMPHPVPPAEQQEEETSGDFDAFDLFHPPESLK